MADDVFLERHVHVAFEIVPFANDSHLRRAVVTHGQYWRKGKATEAYA